MSLHCQPCPLNQSLTITKWMAWTMQSNIPSCFYLLFISWMILAELSQPSAMFFLSPHSTILLYFYCVHNFSLCPFFIASGIFTTMLFVISLPYSSAFSMVTNSLPYPHNFADRNSNIPYSDCRTWLHRPR